ncbi:hypothetical protein JTT01_11325 [Clostridium botulinum]|nr:hypothetical protein [Clostridium botulinum]MCS4478515.1 hypothetical protein [Clostridium botulinum]MCS4521813.1 hypothetical protein [Clostridium botulinum]
MDKNSSINYFTKEFADETLTKHAQQNALKASQALSLTALDLIQMICF